MNLMVLCCFLKMDANYMITIKVKKTQKLIYRINALKLIMVINNKLIQRKDQKSQLIFRRKIKYKILKNIII